MVRLPTTARRKAIVLVALVTLFAGVAFALRPRLLPDLSACVHVREGMTEAEVAAIFGGAADTDACWLFDLPNSKSFPGTPKYWYCDAGVVEVRFDSQGKAQGVYHLSYGFQSKPSLWRSLLKSLGL